MRQPLLRTMVVIAATVLAAGALQAGAEDALNQGQSLAQRGDIRGAMAAYSAVVAANPQWAEAHVRLGGMQLLNRAYTDAVRSFQTAIRLGDDSARPFVGMGMAYLHLGWYQAARASLLEAKVRGTTRMQDVDHVLDWLDSRDSQPVK